MWKGLRGQPAIAPNGQRWNNVSKKIMTIMKIMKIKNTPESILI